MQCLTLGKDQQVPRDLTTRKCSCVPCRATKGLPALLEHSCMHGTKPHVGIALGTRGGVGKVLKGQIREKPNGQIWVKEAKEVEQRLEEIWGLQGKEVGREGLCLWGLEGLHDPMWLLGQ